MMMEKLAFSILLPFLKRYFLFQALKLPLTLCFMWLRVYLCSDKKLNEGGRKTLASRTKIGRT